MKLTNNLNLGGGGRVCQNFQLSEGFANLFQFGGGGHHLFQLGGLHLFQFGVEGGPKIFQPMTHVFFFWNSP